MRLTPGLCRRACLSRGRRMDLPADTAAHVAKVLRARSGDPLVLFNGDGREFAGEIDERARLARAASAMGATAGGRSRVAAGRRRWCNACRAATAWISSCRRPRNSAWRASCRCSASAAWCASTSRQAASKAAHWRAVAVSACEQCGTQPSAVDRCAEAAAGSSRRARRRRHASGVRAAVRRTCRGCGRHGHRRGSAARWRSPSGRRAGSPPMSSRRFAWRVSTRRAGSARFCAPRRPRSPRWHGCRPASAICA